jgi:hypothetical protein
VTMVLLKVDWICTIPVEIFFFTRFLVMVFFDFFAIVF